MKKYFATFLTLLATLTPTSIAGADPCGMVPPIYLGPQMPIARIGLQQTYAFYKNGIESIVIRPGFEGQVEEFGMLIPFPSPPAIRKIADDVFPHVAAAIDPPEITVDLRQRYFRGCCDMAAPAAAKMSSLGYTGRREAEEQLVVLREEAVGMYEVAVLDAGSARVLKEWMDENGFQYPDGMDDVCDEYVDAGWCFVAVKAKVGGKSSSDPRPGMREVDNSLPKGASFDGHVQAMGFRFRTDEFVVPMRLSAFNEGELRNVVYLLSESGQKIANMPDEFVQRQISGYELYGNVTEPLPLRLLGGNLSDIPDWQRQSLKTQRDPELSNGIAREIFAADLLAARTGLLSHSVEEMEKELLAIGESLGLRGPELDAMHRLALETEREEMINQALTDLYGMTLTVIDGDFPREVIANQNLTFVAYNMPTEKNHREQYDSKYNGPAPAMGGFISGPGGGTPLFTQLFGAAALLGLVMLLLAYRPGRRQIPRVATVSAGLALGFLVFGQTSHAQLEELEAIRCGVFQGELDDGVPTLLARALSSESVIERGQAIVRLSEIGGDTVETGLAQLQDGANSPLVQLWSTAALVQIAESTAELSPLANRTNSYPALVRPVTKRFLEFLDEDDDVELQDVLAGIANSHPLQQKILPRLLQREATEFVDVLLTGETQQARNLAAGCLATLAAQQREGVQVDLLAGLAFDPEAVSIPWAGGPLFLPQCQWNQEEAQRIFRDLIAWHLFADRGSLKEAQTQIYNALNSWGLANAAGYTMPGSQIDTTRWLLVLGETLGEEELRDLLEEQDLEDHYRYKAVLTLVSKR